MIEIIKIILIFPIFFLFLIFPINSFNKNKKIFKYDIYPLNLMINLNILLLFSLLPIAIEKYQNIFLFIYILCLIIKLLNKNVSNLFYDKKTLLIFFISFLIISLSVSNNLQLGWDAKYFYYIKTLFFYEGLHLGEIKNFIEYKWHPHFGSYLWAFFWKIPLVDFEYFGRLFYVFLFCFSLINIIFKSQNNFYFKIIFFLTTLILTFSYERFSGLQEILIFSLLVISSKILYNLKKNRSSDIIGLFLIGNLLIWIKSEGIFFAVVLLTILGISKKLSHKKKLVVFFITILIIFFKKIIYLYLGFDSIGQPFYNLDFILSLNIVEIINRVKNIIIYSSYYGLTNIGFLLGICILFFLNFKNIEKININIFNYFFALNLLFIFCAYIFREMEIIYSLRSTLDRIIFISSGYYYYLIYLYANKKINT